MAKPKKKSPAFQFYPSNFLGSPKVRAMSMAEIGLYTVALCLDWDGDGFTLDELRDLASSQRMRPADFTSAWRAVSRCFENLIEANGERFRNSRLTSERRKQREWRRKSSKGGKLGAAKRWGEHDKGGIGVVTPNDDTLFVSPSPTPSPTQKKKESWLLAVAAAYEQRKGAGSFPHAKAGRLLKPLHAAGNTGEEIATRLGRYIDWLDDQKYLSLQKFRETFGDYSEGEPAWVRKLGGYPEFVIDGELTEYGERVTRPVGLRIA